MLPPSLRLHVRHQARSVFLQVQRGLNSTGPRQKSFVDFLSWMRGSRAKHRQSQRTQPRPSSGNVQGHRPRPAKTKGTKKTKRSDSVRSKAGKHSSSTQTREQRILNAVATTLVEKKQPDPAVDSWSGENWATSGWGVDRLRPPPPHIDPVVRVEKPESLELGSERPESRSNERTTKSEVAYTRKLDGVLTPLGSPVLQDVAPVTEHRPIATLTHNLDRILFNPGVHWLQEPRSGVYNFTPWLQNIPDVNDFAFERLPAFVKSSRDKDLWELAKREGKMFGGSTSSLTGMLSQVYFLISGIRMPDTSSLSKPFSYLPADFTPGQRMPASVLLNYKDGAYAIDSAYHEKDDPEKNVLTWLGTLLEKFLTMPPEQFRRLLRDSPDPAVDSGETREAYRYAKSRRFVMRSQLDCHDPRLPGTGIFDLKTRAVLPVRMDLMNYKQHSTYLIRTLQGEMESFEREYQDLIRSAFLKFGFQARIGNMDGILVAHHNTARIFGFRYIPLVEMDACLFGGEDRGEAVFEKCVLLLEEILMEVICTFPKQTVRCLFETRGDKLDVYIEPDVHDEREGPRPIAHIMVQSTSYVNGNRTNSERAIAEPGTWDLHWSICHTSLSQEEKEHNLRKARERQWRAYILPAGVSIEKMEDIWNQLDFGGKQRQPEKSETSPDDNGRIPSSGERLPLEKESTFDPSFFSHPGKNVQLLRELSVRGKADMEAMLEKTKGRPKLIWGEPEAYGEQDEIVQAPSETEMVEASEVAGEPLAMCEDAADEDVGTEVTAPLTDCSQVEEGRR